MHRLVITASALALAACSASPSPSNADTFIEPPTGAKDVSSNTDVERFFPLVDGTVYSYRTETEEGDQGMLIARVHRVDATHGELRYPTGRKRFVFTPDGVALESNLNYVLKGPIQVGTRFTGQNGGQAQIVDVGVTMTVKAGTFDGCLRVVEERRGDRPARYSTVFCPTIGVVAIDAAAGMSFERAELVSAGPAVNLNDGTTVVPGPEPPPSQIPGPPPPPGAPPP